MNKRILKVVLFVAGFCGSVTLLNASPAFMKGGFQPHLSPGIPGPTVANLYPPRRFRPLSIPGRSFMMAGRSDPRGITLPGPRYQGNFHRTPQMAFRPMHPHMPRYAAPVPPRYFGGESLRTAFRPTPSTDRPGLHPTTGFGMMPPQHGFMPPVAFRPRVTPLNDQRRYRPYASWPQVARIYRPAPSAAPYGFRGHYRFRPTETPVARSIQVPAYRFARYAPPIPTPGTIPVNYRFRPVQVGYRTPGPVWTPFMAGVYPVMSSGPGYYPTPPSHLAQYRFRPDPRFQVSQIPFRVKEQVVGMPKVTQAGFGDRDRLLASTEPRY